MRAAPRGRTIWTVLLTVGLLHWPDEVELDLIEDELFATDYHSASHRRHLTVLPEPPTMRLPDQPASPGYARVAGAVWSAVPLDPADTDPVDWDRVDVEPLDTVQWLPVNYQPSPYSPDENGTEIIALVGLAIMLVVGVAATVVIMLRWA